MRPVLATTLLTGVLLGGCADFRENASAGIAETVSGTSFGPKPTQTADFVTRTRPADAPFMAVGVSAPERSLKPKTKAEVEAAQARLAAAAQAQAASGAATAAEGQRVTARQPKPPAVE